MSNITRRIEKLEKQMSLGKEIEISECIIILHEIDGLEHEQEQRDKLRCLCSRSPPPQSHYG